jgi:hypothetical protein
MTHVHQTHRGKGRLDDGTLVSYTLYEFQEMIPANTLDGPARIPGMRSLHGSMKLLSGSLPAVGQLCTLQMEDGRRINLYRHSQKGVRGTGDF